MACPDDGNPCTSAGCNPTTGACDTRNVGAGVECGAIDPVSCSGPRCDGAGHCVGSGCPPGTSCCAGACTTVAC